MRFAALLLLFLLAAPATPSAEPPNVVFLFIDDMGYGDLSVTGNRAVRTENIDRLAAEGRRFTQFYVASPICSPSRVAVTTGQYPSRHFIYSFLNSRRSQRERGMANYLDPRAPSVARAFRDAGYATAHVGKWHMGGGRDIFEAPLPREYGFDESLASFEGLGERILPPGRLSDMSAMLGKGPIWRVEKHEQTPIYIDRSIDFIRRNRERPFYLHLWFNDVHDVHVPSAEQLAKYEGTDPNPYEVKMRAVLGAMDREIGRLVAEIDRLGLAERTLIVLTSDNGPTAWPRYYEEGFDPPGSTGGDRGRKWSLYEGGIRMPLIARWPGRIPPGGVDETTILNAVDLFPTFCALAGVAPPPADFDGEDMSRAFTGGPMTRARPLYWEYGRHRSDLRPGLADDRSPALAIRDGRWKLLVNHDGSGSELYDFGVSRTERENVAGRFPQVAERLRGLLLGWQRALPKLDAGRAGAM